jgi:antitoxin VapB
VGPDCISVPFGYISRMASLFIKDPETAAIVARVAKRTGLTKTALVRELAAAREAELDGQAGIENVHSKLADFYRRYPPASPAVTPDHKAFFDAMWGEQV